jgi:class 3 adenylate cyclase
LGVVRDFKGDVIKFCGDAVMIIWPVSNNASTSVQAAAVYLAAKCALQILMDCGNYSRVENTYKVQLRLHCGIGSGLIHCMCLGEDDRWEFLISGDPLRQVGAAESEAGIGEVCMSEEAYSLVSDKFQAVEMPEGSMNLVISKATWKKHTQRSESSGKSSHQSQTFAMPDENIILGKLHSEQSGMSSTGGASSSRTEATGLESAATSGHLSLSRSNKSPSPTTNDRDNEMAAAFSPVARPNRSALGFMFSHSPVTSAPPAISMTEAGESLDKEFADAVAAVKAYLGDFLRSGYVPVRLLFPVLDKFMMEPAKKAIDHDTLNYVAELRQVVTLFVEVLGLEDDFNMGFVRRPQKVLALALQCLKRYTGSLRQFVVDDKGCVLIAAFGLPGSSHEDNAVRAIETASSLRDSLLEMKVDCRIGIAQGNVYCGLVGSDERCEYAMMGSSVNLAARLMGKAEVGKILVNETVHTAAENHYRFHTLQKIKAKGYAKLVTVYVPFERIQSHHMEPVVAEMRSISTVTADVGEKVLATKAIVGVGRVTELSSFKKSLEIYAASPLPSVRRKEDGEEEVVANGSHQAHIVEGVAGVGKTWFLTEIIKIAKHIDGISHIYMCSALGQMQQSASFLIVVQLMEQIFGVPLANKMLTPMTGRQNMAAAGKRLTDQIQQWFRLNGDDGMIRAYAGKIQSNLFSGDDDSIYESKRRQQSNCDEEEKQVAPRRDRALDEPLKRASSMSIASPSKFLSEDNVEHTREFHVAELLPLLSDILPVHIDESTVTESLSFTSRRAFTLALMLRILELALERKKSILIVENIQWCDTGSIALLNIWLSAQRGCFFLGTIRSEDGSKKVEQQMPANGASDSKKDLRRRFRGGEDALKLEENSNTAYMVGVLYQKCSATALHSFSAHEILQLVERTIDPVLLTQYPQILSSDNIACILKQTNGSPILTHMLLKELEDVLQKGRFSSIDDLPSSYQALILSRFDKLSPTDQIILKVASVIGQNFSQDDLANVLFRCGNINSSQKLSDSLDALVSSHLLEIVSNPNVEEVAEVSYAFVNRGIHDGIYFLMLEGQRKFTHGVIGSLIEEQFDFAYNPTQFMAALSHFLRSDKVEKKFEYLVNAAKYSKRDNDHYTAANCFGDLVQLMTEQSIGSMLMTCTTKMAVGGSKGNCLLPNIRITIGDKFSKLERRSAQRNLLATPGFGIEKKWLQVHELQSKFSYHGEMPVQAICMWIGEVAKARLK